MFKGSKRHKRRLIGLEWVASPLNKFNP